MTTTIEPTGLIATDITLVQRGASYLEKFRAGFKPKGLHRVVAAARQAEAGDGRARLHEELAAAEAQLAQTAPNSAARLQAQAARDRIHCRLEATTPAALSAGLAVWNDPASIRLLRGDAEALLDAVNREMDRVIELQSRFNRDNGLPADRDELRASSAPFHALCDFAQRHLNETVNSLRVRDEYPDDEFRGDVTQVSWILAGCGWRDLKL